MNRFSFVSTAIQSRLKRKKNKSHIWLEINAEFINQPSVLNISSEKDFNQVKTEIRSLKKEFKHKLARIKVGKNMRQRSKKRKAFMIFLMSISSRGAASIFDAWKFYQAALKVALLVSPLECLQPVSHLNIHSCKGKPRTKWLLK